MNKERVKISISELFEIQKRQNEINDNNIYNVDFLDAEGNIITIDPKIMIDWKYTGFYLTGFDKDEL